MIASNTRIASVIQAHCQRVLQNAGSAGVGPSLQQHIRTMEQQYAQKLADTLSTAFTDVTASSRFKTVKREDPSYNFILSAVGSLILPEAAKAFPPGYLSWIDQTATTQFDSGDIRPLVHFIVLYTESAPEMAVHLSILDPPAMFLAFDLLSPQEMSSAGLADARPVEVKRQWGVT